MDLTTLYGVQGFYAAVAALVFAVLACIPLRSGAVGGRLSRYASPLIGVFILLGVIAIGSASASADPPTLPTYEAGMTFPEIRGPSYPEEYSWEVRLGEEQELELVDEQHVEVFYAEGHQHAYTISAEEAHDADGSTVPTSLTVSAGNVLTLIVHHRAGNPAAGGAPFVYPVVPGAGWEGGFVTEIVVGPKDEQELKEERERLAREKQEALEREWGKSEAPKSCLVPRLEGRSLKASKRRLAEAGCEIGKVRKLRGATARTGKVVKQSPRPAVTLAPGASVTVTLGA